MRHFAWSSDRDGVRRLVPLPNPDGRLCFACKRPIESLADGYVMICDAPTLGYPNQWETLRLCLSHDGCFPDRGGERIKAPYSIGFPKLLRDGLDGPGGWVAHLREKQWWAPTYEFDLRDAYALALQLKRRADHAVRRASILPPRGISTRTRTRIFERDGFRCRRCGRGPDDGVALHCDHVVPRAAGGLSDDANLQTLCVDCNLGKSDRAPHAHDVRGLDRPGGAIG